MSEIVKRLREHSVSQFDRATKDYIAETARMEVAAEIERYRRHCVMRSESRDDLCH